MEKTIVIIDSGAGGLTYLRALKQYAISYNVAYIADTAHYPYGLKSPQQLQAIFENLLPKIKSFNPFALLIACNTASLHGFSFFQSQLNCPVIPTKPSLKQAYSQSKNKKIAVLATAASLSSPNFQNSLKKYPENTFLPVPATDLIAFIEKEMVDSTALQQLQAIQPYFDPLMASGCDTVVLGCTHFIHLKEVMSRHYPTLQLIDNSKEVAQQVISQIEELQENKDGYTHLYQTGPQGTEQYKKLAHYFAMSYQGSLAGSKWD